MVVVVVVVTNGCCWLFCSYGAISASNMRAGEMSHKSDRTTAGVVAMRAMFQSLTGRCCKKIYMFVHIGVGIRVDGQNPA